MDTIDNSSSRVNPQSLPLRTDDDDALVEDIVTLGQARDAFEASTVALIVAAGRHYYDEPGRIFWLREEFEGLVVGFDTAGGGR